MKTCINCKIEKDETDFCKNKTLKAGITRKCKACIGEYKKEYYEEHKEEIKEYKKKYQEENKEEIKEYKKKYQEENKEKIKKNKKEYYQENKESINERKKEYYQENKESVNERKKEYNKNRRNMDKGFRILCNLRTRLHSALKGISKTAPTMELVGCSIEFLRDYLEGTKVEGKDYSDAHIDHIRPCASFDLTDPEQQRECFHYTNLQYLPAQENMSKGVRIL